MKILTLILLMISLGCMSASIDEVISGQKYDGIHRMENGEFLVATGDAGTIVRFDSQGNQSVILSAGTAFIGVTEDAAGNIYASDFGASRIIKINTNGQQEIFTTGVNSPGHLAVAQDGSLYVGSLPNSGVFQVNQPGVANLIISGDLAPGSLASTFDDEGNYYVGNSFTAEIFRYSPSGEFSLFATLPITTGGFRLGGLVFFDGYIYATGYSNNSIYRVNMNGDIIVAVGPGAIGDAANFKLNGPAGITAGNQTGEIYVSNFNSAIVNRIQLDEIPDTIIPHPSGLSGSWFDPELDGEGYNIIYNDNGLLVYFYGYNDQGERLWLISDLYNGEMNFGQVISLTFFELTGGSFAVPASPTDNTSEWGALEITFDDCKNGLFSLNGIDGIKNSQVILLAGISGVLCK